MDGSETIDTNDPAALQTVADTADLAQAAAEKAVTEMNGSEAGETTALEALQFAVDAAKEAQAAAEKAAAKGSGWLDWFALIEHVPGLLLILVVIVILYKNRERLGGILDRVSGFKAMGVEIELSAKKELGKAVSLRTEIKTTVSGEKKNIKITEDDERRAIKRAVHAIDALKGQTALWVDDLPGNNRYEVQAFREFGLNVIQVVTNKAAVEQFKSGDLRADVVISDIKRPDGEPSGVDLLDDFVNNNIDVPIVYYITKVDEDDPLPAAQDGTTASGLTNRPDELIHLVLDVLERRWPLS